MLAAIFVATDVASWASLSTFFQTCFQEEVTLVTISCTALFRMATRRSITLTPLGQHNLSCDSASVPSSAEEVVSSVM